MIQFNIPDMTCGACANRIGRALSQAGLPPELQVEIDVAARQMRIPQGIPEEVTLVVQKAIEQAGYTAQQVTLTQPALVASRPSGCCCASRRVTGIDVGQGVPAKNAGCCG